MKRRKLLATGGSIAFGSIAGCLGGDDGGDEQEPTTTSEPEEEQTTESSEKSNAGGVSFSVEPSATEIDWGEEYTVTVTVQAGDEPLNIATGIIYQTEDDSQWSGSFSETEKMWRLDAGESQKETFDIEPPAAGEVKVGLVNSMEENVVEEWELEVLPPTAAFGETISYYDGLDMTLDAELHEWMDFEISWNDGKESGVCSVRPKDGQWVKVKVVAENTNTNQEVRLPGDDKFSGLAGNSQLNSPRSLGTTVGEGTNYEIDNETRHEERAWMEMYKDGVAQQEGYWYPPSELVSGAVEEGWILFDTKETDITVEDVEIRLKRNDIRATWG